MASSRAVCKSVWDFISVCVLPRPPFILPFIRSEYEADWTSGPRWEREPRQMREWVSFYTHSLALPLFAAIPLSVFFPALPLLPFAPHPLSLLALMAPFCISCSKQAAIAQRGRKLYCLFCLSCAIRALPLFLMIYLLLYSQRLFSGDWGENLFFIFKDLIS